MVRHAGKHGKMKLTTVVYPQRSEKERSWPSGGNQSKLGSHMESAWPWTANSMQVHLEDLAEKPVDLRPEGECGLRPTRGGGRVVRNSS